MTVRVRLLFWSPKLCVRERVQVGECEAICVSEGAPNDSCESDAECVDDNVIEGERDVEVPTRVTVTAEVFDSVFSVRLTVSEGEIVSVCREGVGCVSVMLAVVDNETELHELDTLFGIDILWVGSDRVGDQD